MYRYSKEDQEKIAAARKRNKDKRVEKRLYALKLRAEGKSAEEVSAATGFHKAYISQLTVKYREGRIKAITGKHYGGNRRNMSAEEEAALLKPFQAEAEKGQIVEVSKIKGCAAFSNVMACAVGRSSVQVVPRTAGLILITNKNFENMGRKRYTGAG